MTPQEKAQELVDKYYQLAESIEWTDEQTSLKAEKFNDELGSDVLKYWNELSKQSALIAVDEIILSAPFEPVDTDWDEAGASAQYWYPQKLEDSAKWWGEVKQEIELL